MPKAARQSSNPRRAQTVFPEGQRSISVRYVCTGLAVELVKDGAGNVRTVHSLVLAPDPEDTSYVNGTQIKLGLPEPLGFGVGDVVTLNVRTRAR